MSYKQLDFLQRRQIYGLWRAGRNQTEIAKEIGVHKSTISREFKRNIFWWGSRIPQYRPDHAQSKTEDRHKRKQKRVKFTKEIEAVVQEKLLKRIYQFILENKKKCGDLYKHLRHQHKRYRKRYGSPKRNGPIKNRIMIDQ